MGNRKSINIIGWTLAILTSLAYTLTMYPTISFWDSGEFVTTAATLQVGHPPGAPFYQILGAFFSIFAFGNPVWTTRLVSLISPLAMGLSVMFLFWILVRMLGRFSTARPGNIIASVVGALCFAFADSVWFSATEAEVYALSVLFSLITFWLVLKWDATGRKRYLLLAVYVLGIASTVHILSLLVVPAAIMIVYFHRRRTYYRGLILYLLIGAAALVLLILLSTVLALGFLMLFPEPLVGVAIYLLAVLVGIFLARKHSKTWLEFSLLALTFFLVGTSTYNVILQRSRADVPLNYQKPDSPTALFSYINRENYQKAPLLYGQYYTATPPESIEATPQGLKPHYAKEQKTVFPRMWDCESLASETGYIEWTGQPEKNVIINGEERPKPSFSQNLRFLFSYQINYMYLRYLFWNFCGRTNDVQGFGDYKNSQWFTGIKPADDFLSVGSDNLNPQAAKGTNRYFAIPLLLALVGLFYQGFKDTKHFTVNATLFFYNSLALVFFLNMAAYQARERDYVYLLSFAAMAVWIAVGVLGISQTVVNWLKVRHPRYVAWIFLAVPVLMFWQNLDDHNHRHQYTARNFAISMLESCQPNAILFTNGDNDTFPLWYVQNVENVRRDVRVVNLQTLNSLSQIEQLGSARYSSKSLKTNLSSAQYSTLVYSLIQPSFDTMELGQAISALALAPKEDLSGIKAGVLPTNRFFLAKGTDTLRWSYNSLDLPRYALAALDLIASNIGSRPIYFSAYSVDDFFGLDDYLRLEGLAYRIGEKKKDKEEFLRQKAGTVDEDRMYENLTKRFCWQNFSKDGVYYNETEREIALQFTQAAIGLAYKLFDVGERQKALQVCRLLSEQMPKRLHYCPEAVADVAILYSILGERQKALENIRYAVGEFTLQAERYTHLSERQQSQERSEMYQLMDRWLSMLDQAEEMNLEDIRIELADNYFVIVNSYIRICFRQLERMQKNPDLYADEIERLSSQIQAIYSLAERYEESLVSPPPQFPL